MNAAMVQGRPRPRKTFTELLPVTFPMLLSANGSWIAAVFDAKVSGREVPRATKVIAQSSALKDMAQPRRLARSLMKAVQMPIMTSAQKKVATPFWKSVGGTRANSTFQGKLKKCNTYS